MISTGNSDLTQTIGFLFVTDSSCLVYRGLYVQQVRSLHDVHSVRSRFERFVNVLRRAIGLHCMDDAKVALLTAPSGVKNNAEI